MSAHRAGRRLRVLALPAYGRRQQNPFQALLYDAVATQNVAVEEWGYWRAAWRRCDVWHLHHPDTVVFPRARWQAAAETAVMWLLLMLAKLRGTKVIWTIHDLDSHDGLHPGLERWFWRYFLPRLDAVIALTEAGADLARARFPALAETPVHIVPHGHFRDVYPNTLSRSAARARLGLDPDKTVLLHYGLVRPYKSVPELIAAFAALGGQDAMLLIAGRVWDKALQTQIEAMAAAHGSIRLHLKWIPFEDTEIYFNACDLVVLPYRRILNSGVALLALSFDRPVLVPDMGAMQAHQARFGAQWVRCYSGEIEAKVLREAIAWAVQERTKGVAWTGLDWQSLGRATCEIYDQVLSAPAPASGQLASSKAGPV